MLGLKPFSGPPPCCNDHNPSKPTVSVIACFFAVSSLLLLLPSATGKSPAPPTVKCMLGNDTTCPSHHCCVKKVWGNLGFLPWRACVTARAAPPMFPVCMVVSACAVVITFRDPNKAPLVGTECQPLLPEGAMCLRTPEDYVCACLPGMRCDVARFHTMGYCRLPTAQRTQRLRTL